MLSAAYELLKDPIKRREHDAQKASSREDDEETDDNDAADFSSTRAGQPPPPPAPPPRPRPNTEPSARIELDIGGRKFTTTKATIRCMHGARMDGEPNVLSRALDTGQTVIFVDGDGDIFPEVLRFLRHAMLPTPADDEARQALFAEARQLEIDRLAAYLHGIQFMTYEIGKENIGGRMVIPRGLRMLSYGPPLLCFRWATPSEIRLKIHRAKFIWSERIPGVRADSHGRPEGGESEGKYFLRQKSKDVTELLRSKMTNDEVCCIVEDCAQEAGVPLISEELDHLRRIPNDYLHQHDAIFKAGDPSILEIYFHFENDVYTTKKYKS